MAKRVVICCDGTWNTPDQPAPTNVSRVALAIAPADGTGCEQRMYYHAGVGTRPGERLWGGAFGFGLSRNVREAYRFLVRTFEPGDELFLFGFSRGAYTARSLAGLVRNCGILRHQHEDRIGEAYALYRSRRDRTHPREVSAQLFRRSFARETRIRFLGVWDTVGSLGIPLSGMRLVNLINRRWQFHDTELSSSVDAAYQALAIDEQRPPFKPALWHPRPGTLGQRVEQVWFSGVHSDVGGGYPDRALADISLLWMVERARANGLAFEPGAFAAADLDPLGPVHTSRTGFYKLLPRHVRPLGAAPGGREYAASSAVERHAMVGGYAPNLARYLTDGGAVLPVRSDEGERFQAFSPAPDPA
ncbi:uncharacterized protein (DUF2235 family) [Amycolatopsis endophytica]|uniref:Uncharacterized protein (DUF2235 family) n=1 Tax=Amycolatopsis endophytica TaxID=860233 RepID=A0A853BDT4_9PSEU|nr:DUF2235 domain-containing protein [Amycolatopsis endophytica]NYI92606.1 uncharacterized protein (DUF2235 family) [Amycolatopsis endophytica]